MLNTTLAELLEYMRAQETPEDLKRRHQIVLELDAGECRMIVAEIDRLLAENLQLKTK